MEMSGQFHAPTALPRVTAPSTHCTGGWVGPRAAPDVTEKRNISCPCRGATTNVTATSYSMGTGSTSPRLKQTGREGDHSHLVPRLRIVELYLHSPIRLHGVVLNELSTVLYATATMTAIFQDSATVKYHRRHVTTDAWGQ
jgi:hypothetical protein